MYRIEQKSTESLSPACDNIGSFAPDISIQLQGMKIEPATGLHQQNTYAFYHSEGSDATRFNVIFKGSGGLGESKSETNGLWIAGSVLYISAPDYTGKAAQVSIYSPTGQLILQKRLAVGQLSMVDLSSINSAEVIARLIVDGKVLATKGVLVQEP